MCFGPWSEKEDLKKYTMEHNLDASQYIVLNELNDSAAQLAFRPSYDLLWDQLTSETLIAFKRLEQEGGSPHAVILPLWRLIEHLREELCIVRKASNRTLSYVLEMKAHEEMIKRQKLEKIREKHERQTLKRLAAEETQPAPLPPVSPSNTQVA